MEQKLTKDQVLAVVIREILQRDPGSLNDEMAREATEKLGYYVDRKAVSRVRNKIGYGWFHLMFARHKRGIGGYVPMPIGEVMPEPNPPTQLDYTLQQRALHIAFHCVRETIIEDYHAAGKITDPEMEAFNKEVVNRIYTVLQMMLNPKYEREYINFLQSTHWLMPTDWDEPEFDKDIVEALKKVSGYGKEKTVS